MASQLEKSVGLQSGHVGLNVSNLERSKNFYRDVLGFQVAKESVDDGRRFAFLSDGDSTVLTLWEQSKGTFLLNSPACTICLSVWKRLMQSRLSSKSYVQ